MPTPYQPMNWKDRVVEKPRTYNFQNNPDGTVTLNPVTGAVQEAGTPVNATNMNNIETGIQERATWDSVHSLEQELIELKMLSTLKDVVDGGTDYFYDDGGSGQYAYKGSSLELEKQFNVLKTGTSVGATTMSLLYKFSSKVVGFSVGQEVTIQSGDNPTQFERKVISAINTTTNTITFSTSLTKAYTAGTLIYRSFVSRASDNIGFAQMYKYAPVVDPNLSALTLAYSGGGAKAERYPIGSMSSSFSVDAEVICSIYGSTAAYFAKRTADGLYDSMFTISTGTIAGVDAAQISPNGRYFAVPDATARVVTIYKIADDYKSYSVLTVLDLTAASTMQVGSLAWSPLNNYLAIGCAGTANKINIWKITNGGDTFTPVAGVPQPTQTISNINWSPDEQWLSFLNQTYNPWIRLMRQVGGVFTLLPTTTTPAGSSSYNPGNAVFSPDSQQFVYSYSQGSGSSWRVFYHYKWNGTAWTLYKQLGSSTYQNSPIFSPDGQYIYGFDGGTIATKWTTFDTSTTQVTPLPVITELNVPTQLWSTTVTSWWFTDPLGKIVGDYRKGVFAAVTPVEALTEDIRYKAKSPAKVVRGVVAFVKRNTAVPVTVTAAFSANGTTENFANVNAITETVDSTTVQDTFAMETGVNGNNAVLRMSMTRTAGTSPTIKKITGATE